MDQVSNPPDKISFRNDYSDGAHPHLLQALVAASGERNAGYGNDRHSLRAAALIRERIGRADADVHFLCGGTQANLTVIAAFLRPHEAVIAVDSGHIATHETGAIEASGHKVLTIASVDGKLNPTLIQSVLDAHSSEHMVRPRMAYISNTSETGTVYSRAELQALRDFCDVHDLYLFMDGARLASALTSAGNDLTLADIAALADAFSIGGTKNGALLGEALVIGRESLKPDFRFLIKQRGGMLAKGMVIGSQFEALFEDNLYLQLGVHANTLAQRLRQGIQQAGFAMASESPSNQLFPILPKSLIEQLQQTYEFECWQAHATGTAVIRLVTSWASRQEDVDHFIADLNRLRANNPAQDASTTAAVAAQGH